MKPYNDYIPFDAEAFLMDPAFRAWIANPTPEMSAYWQGLLGNYPHLSNAFEQARLLAQGMKATWIPFSQTYVDELYKRTVDNLPGEIVEKPIIHKKLSTQVIWRYAAALVPLLMCAWAYAYYFRGQLIHTGNSQLKTLTLYDGSVIKLNANSQLRIPSRFDWSSNREVWLTGEGFFAVQKQLDDQTGNKRKFTVHTKRADVVVLGTRFTVYDRSLQTRVLLEEGRVALTDPVARKMFLMKPGEIASYKQGEKTYQLAKADMQDQRSLTAWRSQILAFENVSMPELKQRFEEVYGMELVLEGEEFKGQQFTGELPLNDTQKALNILSETFELKAVPYQNRIYFVPNP